VSIACRALAIGSPVDAAYRHRGIVMAGSKRCGNLTPMPDATTAADPRPVPPVRPGSDECCRSACDSCVFDFYEDAVERYRAELKAWQERSARREQHSDRSRP